MAAKFQIRIVERTTGSGPSILGLGSGAWCSWQDSGECCGIPLYTWIGATEWNGKESVPSTSVFFSDSVEHEGWDCRDKEMTGPIEFTPAPYLWVHPETLKKIDRDELAAAIQRSDLWPVNQH